MPSNVENRLGKAVSKAGHVCTAVRSEVSIAVGRLSDVTDNLDAIVGGAHNRATRVEIEALTIALDEAVTEGEIAAREIAASVAKVREVRGRLDRALSAYRAFRREEPMVPMTLVPPAEERARQAGSEPEEGLPL